MTLLHCFTAPFLTFFSLRTRQKVSCQHYTPTLILWPSIGDCHATMNSPLKSFQASSPHTHAHTQYSNSSLSPVKQQRSHPLFPFPHIFQSHTLCFRNLYSRSRIFIKTCNNTDCSFSVHSCLSDMKEEVKIFSYMDIWKKSLWVEKGSSALSTPLPPVHNHPNTSISWYYLSTSPLCYPPGRPMGRHGTTSGAILPPQKQQQQDRKHIGSCL